MKGLCPLASGSKGNCLYLGTANTKILIDAGISGKATQSKLQEIGVDISEIQAILVTHEHTDHIQGLKVLSSRYNIPILANAETARGIYNFFHENMKFKIFTTEHAFTFGDLEILPFSVQHDTIDPVMFTIKTDLLKIGICTDLGCTTTLVRSHLSSCDYLVIEANHEPSMVHSCSRPMSYKNRVLGKSGHLSNEQCAELLAEIIDDKLKHVHLAHLSQECNHQKKALETVRAKIGNHVKVSIAYQEKISNPVVFDEVESFA